MKKRDKANAETGSDQPPPLPPGTEVVCQINLIRRDGKLYIVGFNPKHADTFQQVVGVGDEAFRDPVLRKAISAYSVLVDLAQRVARDPNDDDAAERIGELHDQLVYSQSDIYRSYVTTVSYFLQKSAPTTGVLTAEQAARGLIDVCSSLCDERFNALDLGETAECIVEYHSGHAESGKRKNGSRNPDGRSALKVPRFAAKLAISVGAFPVWRARAEKDPSEQSMTDRLADLLRKYTKGAPVGHLLETVGPEGITKMARGNKE